jgi:hypothetical protein
MGKRITLFLVTAGSLLAFNGPVRGQEVNSDVNIPPPRELVSGAPAINGLLGGTEFLLRSSDRLFRGSSAQVAVGIMDEGETREEFGDFMTSLLVKAGIIAFDRPPAPLAASNGSSEDGSWPAWTGRTPTTLSVSRAARFETLRRR